MRVHLENLRHSLQYEYNLQGYVSTGVLVLMDVCLKSYLRSEVWNLGFKTSVVTIL